MISVTRLLRYPIKSCRGEFLNNAEITDTGLKHDRNWALFDTTGQAITGRQNAQMLDIKVQITDETATIVLDKTPQISFSIENQYSKPQSAKIFSYDVTGYEVSRDIDQWFSEYLQKEVKMLFASDLNRPVLPKHGGKEKDLVSFADQAPILLLSEASVKDLNSRLGSPITFHRFRPNIVIKGCFPYAEDEWKEIKIGECHFEVIQKCERCIFTTIDPKSKLKDPNKEPLKTLSSYRKKHNGGVDFGVHLVPRKLGHIRLDDRIELS
ncbi:MAG: MOSC domain-containing protein [Saprospiraceae bacterium]|nr:MOSC domain-containing protein [Saprospiraceae bacterium]|tara:strand:- start:330 stop:1130 length:801 start_codon:yes stop_codon:yes gene_type:complete